MKIHRVWQLILGKLFSSAGRRPAVRRARLSLELLEDRAMPSLVTVTSASDDPSDTGSLRYAIAHASSGDTIDFAPTVRTIDLSNTLNSAGLTIGVNMSIINDQGVGPVKIDGSGQFTVLAIPASVTASLSGLTIADGNSSPNGGGIYNKGALTVSNCNFSHNFASPGNGSSQDGGGIYNTGALMVSDSTFSNNSASIGGGIYNAGALTINNSIFANNTSGDGGGIYNSVRSQVLVNNSTFSNNSAGSGGSGSGGGVFNAGTLTVSNSTFFNNTASDGGGIKQTGSSTLLVNNCTFANNSASSGGGISTGGTTTVTNSTLYGNRCDQGGSDFFGGGIYAFNSDSALVTLNGDIVAGNVNTFFGTPDDIASPVNLSCSDNLIGTGSGGLFDGVNGNQVGASIANISIGALGSNGGPTQTFAIGPGSFAIGKGVTETISTTDQRGVARPINAPSDVGAFQYAIDTVAPTVSLIAPADGSSTTNMEPTLSATAADIGGSGLSSVQLQYRSHGASTWNNAGTAQTSGPFTLTFNSPLSDGVYDFRAVATDNAGNSNATAAHSFTVDTTPPTSSVSSLLPFSPATFTLSWSGSDNGGSGIASYNIFVSDNGASYEPFLTGTPQVWAAFSGVPGHTYAFYSTAVDRAGNTEAAPAGPQAVTTIGTGSPSGFIPASPGYDKPKFAWNPVSGADHYNLYVVDTTAGALVISNANVTTTFTPNNNQALTPGHGFTWYLQAYSAGGMPIGSMISNSFTLAALAAPTALKPNSAIPAGSGYDRPTFTWAASPGTDHYYLVVVDTTGGGAPIVVPNVSGTSYTATAAQALTPGHSFTTYVFAVSTNFQVYSQATQSFALAALPAPSGLTPSGSIAAATGYDRPTFTWTASAGADHYYLVVVDNNTGAAPIIVPNIAGTTFTATMAQALTPGHTFSLYVFAVSTNLQVYSQATETFVLAALPAPTSSAPVGTIVTLTPTFTWSEVGADHYYLYVVDDTTGGAVISTGGITTTSFTPSTPLLHGHHYTWWIAAISTNNVFVIWSTGLDFTIS